MGDGARQRRLPARQPVERDVGPARSHLGDEGGDVVERAGGAAGVGYRCARVGAEQPEDVVEVGERGPPGLLDRGERPSCGVGVAVEAAGGRGRLEGRDGEGVPDAVVELLREAAALGEAAAAGLELGDPLGLVGAEERGRGLAQHGGAHDRDEGDRQDHRGGDRDQGGRGHRGPRQRRVVAEDVEAGRAEAELERDRDQDHEPAHDGAAEEQVQPVPAGGAPPGRGGRSAGRDGDVDVQERADRQDLERPDGREERRDGAQHGRHGGQHGDRDERVLRAGQHRHEGLREQDVRGRDDAAEQQQDAGARGARSPPGARGRRVGRGRHRHSLPTTTAARHPPSGWRAAVVGPGHGCYLTSERSTRQVPIAPGSTIHRSTPVPMCAQSEPVMASVP